MLRYIFLYILQYFVLLQNFQIWPVFICDGIIVNCDSQE